MRPPPGQTGCPELGPGKEGSKETRSCNSLHTSCAFVKPVKKHCSFTLLYLQLAAVQAGHWNLLHFHLPALPDEQSLLWSCCRERGIGQNRAAAEGGGIQSTTLSSHTNWGNQLYNTEWCSYSQHVKCHHRDTSHVHNLRKSRKKRKLILAEHDVRPLFS